MLKKLLSKYISYEIVGEYYNAIPLGNGQCELFKKYIRRYYFKPYRKWKQERLSKVNKNA